MLLLLAIACRTGSAPTGPSGPPPALVAVSEVRAGTLDDTWAYLGDVAALERAELAAGASGTVTTVAARAGDRVEPGQILVEVDPAIASAEVAAARAEADRITEQLAQAERTLQRLERVQGGVLAANELEAAESSARALRASAAGADAAVRLAAARLERHRVRAPFAGAVARRHVDPGDWVDPGRQVLDVVSTGAVEIRVEAPLELAGRIAPGQTAEIQGVEPLPATIVGVVPALDPVSRTATVRLTPEAVPDWLVPGTAIPVAFRVQHEGGLVVPRDAIVAGAVEDKVFEVVDGLARAVPVTTLASSADQVLVRGDGLAAGDSVVVRGNERLRPDQPVQVTQ